MIDCDEEHEHDITLLISPSWNISSILSLPSRGAWIETPNMPI